MISSPASTEPTWGKAVWTLYHVLSEAIDAQTFEHNHAFRTELFELIWEICHSLPCPDCRAHAEIETKQRIQWQTVRTKNDLQWMFHAFHNRVNERTGKRIYNVNSLSLQYKPLVPQFYSSVLPSFHREFSKPVRDIHYQNDNAKRLQVADRVVDWFQKYKELFSR